jgi:hypothetical protein
MLWLLLHGWQHLIELHVLKYVWMHHPLSMSVWVAS